MPSITELARPAELSLDLLNELADLARGRFCLLVLDADQRCLVLLIKKPDFEQRIGQQGDANNRNEQRDVFRE